MIVGSAAFVAITFFEQLPIVGWLGALVSFGAWLLLTRSVAEGRGEVPAVWAGIIGGFTGFVGAFTAWLAQTGNLFGLTTAPGDRLGAGFGFVGATLGLVYWPLVGAGFCFALGLYFAGRRLTDRAMRDQATRRRLWDT